MNSYISPAVAEGAASTRTPDDVIAARASNALFHALTRKPLLGVTISETSQIDELKAQALVLPAIAALKSAIDDALLLTNYMGDELKDLRNGLDDACVSAERWALKMREAT